MGIMAKIKSELKPTVRIHPSTPSDQLTLSAFPITVETALESPIYPLLSSPGEHVLHACVLCPRKKMKTDDMVDDHLASQVSLSAPSSTSSDKLTEG